MATETQDILLRLKLEGDAEIKKRNNELLKSITDNKKAIEENNAALKEYKKAGDTSSDAVNQLKLRNIELTSSNRALNAELNNNIKILNNEVGSLNEKRALLNNMNAAYAKLSADQKANTAEGIAQGKAIRALTDELKAEEKALGDTRRNVGNYTDSIIEANSQLGLSGTILGKAITGYKAFKVAALEASGGTSVLNGALKLLAANPIFAIIAVIAGVFMLLKEAIGKNASIVGQFTRALAPLQQILGVIFGVIGDVVKLLVGGFAKSMELVASLFGDAGKAANDYVKALADAAAAEKELFNLRIRQKEEQKVINNLMAVANNRIVEGKARYEAMTKAIDIAIIKGDGTGEPTGITVDSRVPAGNVITLSSADFLAWDGWKKKVFAKIPLSYRAGGSFIMASGTFEGYIDGMVDANGQPIGRVNYGITDGSQERFGGREVILVEDDVIAPYESAANGDIVAVFCKLSDYVVNSNMQMTMYRWLDHDTNQWVDKAILIADGKILDPNGVLIIKKGA